MAEYEIGIDEESVDEDSPSKAGEKRKSLETQLQNAKSRVEKNKIKTKMSNIDKNSQKKKLLCL